MQSQFDTNQHQQEQLQQQEPSEPSVPVVNSGNQPEVRIRDIESERPQTGSRQRKNEFEPYLNGDISNISQFTAANVEYPKRYTKLQKPNEEDNDQKALDIPSLVKPTPFNYEEIRLPEWFDKSSIHEIEFLSLPEIDKEESLSAEEYKIYRNYMVDTYMSNLDYYLTISACKSKLDADLVTLTRIHHFLEMNKVINFKTDPRRRIFDPYIDSDPSAQVNPKSQRNFKDIDKADIQYLRELIYNGAETNSTRSSWDLSIEDPNNPDRRKIFHCSNCKVECSEVRYQSLKSKNYQICIDCFLEGRFPATFFSGDFLRVESANGPDLEMDEVWTDEEILRLLEGVDRFDDDWLMISEHVGSRSKEQCITQFLQLPINDEFLTAKLSKKELEELPFGDLPNPIMAMIAFLSGHINPGIGAAAAKAALKELIKSGEENSTSEQPVEHVDTEIVDVIKEEEEEVNIENKEIDQGAFSREVLRRAATNALKSSVECAHKLASYEEQEIQHWTRLAVKTIIDKLSIKVQQYDEIDTSLASESNDLEKQKNILAGSIEALVGQSFPLQGSEEAASSLHQS
ncbi:MAG: hypothetical protein EXX96DRAFT_483358 [Benjaminiella poitrasii]|nr:MAG: hypothetical protein EXX96DRAFT_483358 [Benjaminiella poitrasii]